MTADTDTVAQGQPKPTDAEWTTMPPEVWAGIFRLSISGTNALSPLQLGQICSGWRTIAFQTGELWSQVDFRFQSQSEPIEKYKAKIALLREWIDRANGVPINLSMIDSDLVIKVKPQMQLDSFNSLGIDDGRDVDSDEDSDWEVVVPPKPLVEVIQDGCSQISSLTLHLSREFFNFFDDSDKLIWPNLSHLEIHTAASTAIKWTKATFQNSPKLASLSVRNFRLASLSLPFSSLSNVRLYSVAALEVTFILNNAPNLEAMYVEECSGIATSTPPPVHENLRRFTYVRGSVDLPGNILFWARYRGLRAFEFRQGVHPNVSWWRDGRLNLSELLDWHQFSQLEELRIYATQLEEPHFLEFIQTLSSSLTHIELCDIGWLGSYVGLQRTFLRRMLGGVDNDDAPILPNLETLKMVNHLVAFSPNDVANVILKRTKDSFPASDNPNLDEEVEGEITLQSVTISVRGMRWKVHDVYVEASKLLKKFGIDFVLEEYEPGGVFQK